MDNKSHGYIGNVKDVLLYHDFDHKWEFPDLWLQKMNFPKLCQKLHRQILAQPLHGSGMGNVQTLLYVTEPYLWILVTGITRRIGKGNQALYRKTEWDGFVLKYAITHHCFSGLFIRIMALSILKLPIPPCSLPTHGACE